MTRENEQILKIAGLDAQAETAFDYRPDADATARIAGDLDLLGLRKARIWGTVRPMGKRDWALEARIGATVVQPCVVTLAPVTTRIEEPVERTYLARFETPEAAEVEIPDDVSAEPLPEEVDLAILLSESIALALPPYPRSDDADHDSYSVSEPGVAPLTDEDVSPFAALKGLKDSLGTDETPE